MYLLTTSKVPSSIVDVSIMPTFSITGTSHIDGHDEIYEINPSMKRVFEYCR